MTGTPARRLAAALAAAGLLAPGSLPGCAAPGEEAAPAAPPSAAEGSPAAPPSSSAAAGRVVDPRTLVFGETPFAFPKTERAVLSNGMVVHMMRDATLPIVRAAALFRGGTVFDPEGREGLASLASAMVREGGTTNLPIEELEDELDLLAGEVGTGADQEMLTASFSFLSKDLERGVAIFADVLRNPAFDAGRFQQQKMVALQGLRRAMGNPSSVMGRVFGGAVYGSHPYGRVATAESLGAITPEDLRAFHAKWFHPDGMILAVAGDFEGERLLALLEKAFGGWEKAPGPLPKFPDPVDAAAIPGGHFLVPMKGLTQATIRMGHVGPKQASEDRVRFAVMNSILGGGTFTSRMGLAVRTREGLAYGVGSGLTIASQGGMFLATCDTKNSTAYRAIDLMRGIIADMREGPVTQEELDISKESILNSFVALLESPMALARQHAVLEFKEYPAGWLERYREVVRSMTVEEVRRVAREYLHPDRLRIVVVGDPATLEAAPAALGKAEELKPR